MKSGDGSLKIGEKDLQRAAEAQVASDKEDSEDERTPT
jgi:hypothetical protein